MRWIKTHPNSKNDGFFRVLVALYVQQGSLKDAENIADKYLAGNSSVDDKLNIATLKYTLGKVKDAKAIFDAIYKKTGNQEALLQLSNILEMKLNKRDKAITLLNADIKKNSNRPSYIYYKLLQMYVNKKDINNILRVYKELYAMYPDEQMLKDIIRMFMRKKDYAGAISFLEKNNQYGEILFRFYKMKGRTADAIKLAKKMYTKTKDPKWLAEKAIVIYESAKKKKTFDMNSSQNMQNLFNKAFRDGLDDPLYLNYYGYILIDDELDIDKGIVLVKRALKVEPNNIYYLDSLAWGLYRKGKCKSAEEVMKNFYTPMQFPEKELEIHWDAIEKCIDNK